jgi:hypothetical protein
MASDGAALIAAAVRAACLAGAPRRTVQAVAAAVAGVYAQQAAGAAARTRVRAPAPATQCADSQGGVTPESLIEALRAVRRARRQRKKERRRANRIAAAAAETAAGERAGSVPGTQQPDITMLQASLVQLATSNDVVPSAPLGTVAVREAGMSTQGSLASLASGASIATRQSALERLVALDTPRAEERPLAMSRTAPQAVTRAGSGRSRSPGGGRR